MTTNYTTERCWKEVWRHLKECKLVDFNNGCWVPKPTAGAIADKLKDLESQRGWSPTMVLKLLSLLEALHYAEVVAARDVVRSLFDAADSKADQQSP